MQATITSLNQPATQIAQFHYHPRLYQLIDFNSSLLTFDVSRICLQWICHCPALKVNDDQSGTQTVHPEVTVACIETSSVPRQRVEQCA